MRKVFLVHLFFLFAFNFSFGQLKEPINNCTPNPGNASGGDPCDSSIQQTYNPCECQYNKDYRAYLDKKAEYSNKLRQINIELQKYRCTQSSPSHLRNVSEAMGFSEQKRKALNSARTCLTKAQKGLSLSYEKESYCITANCADSSIREFQNYISEINNVIREINNIQPANDIELTISTNSSSDTSKTKGNNSITIETESDEKNTTSLNKIDQEKFNRDWDLRNDVKNAEQSGNYIKAAQIKNANPQMYSKEERKRTTTYALAQAGTTILADALFNVDPEKQAEREKWREQKEKWRDNVKEAKNARNTEKIMSNFSDNGLAVKKNKKGWYGYVDINDNWIIKPKYMDAKPFEDGKALVTTKIGKQFYINAKGKKL